MNSERPTAGTRTAEWTHYHPAKDRWRPASSDAEWTRFQPSHGSSRPRHFYQCVSVPHPVSVLSELNEQIEKTLALRTPDLTDEKLDEEIHRLESLAASLIEAKANVGISRVIEQVESAAAIAKRLLGSK